MFSRSKRFTDAYLATDYVARIDGRHVVVRPGQRSAEVEKAMRRVKTRTAAFITACNPSGRLRGEVANRAAHSALASNLRRCQRPFVEGYGLGHDNRWPAEKSVLAFGLNASAAAKLGRRFRQNAIVFVQFGRRAKLVHLN